MQKLPASMLEAPVIGASIRNGLVPARHLRQTARTSSPVVVLIGDSISTDEPTLTFDEALSFWGYFQNAFRDANPNLTPAFYQRAIGGASWTNLNMAQLQDVEDAGLTLPSWATPKTDSWLDRVEALSPDLVVIHLGMNDRQNFQTAQFRAVMTAINAWAKVPDIVFVTNMVPHRRATNQNISGAPAQEGRNFVANYVRSYAIYNDYGLIDLNALQLQAVQGYDPRFATFTPGTAVAGSTPVVGSTQCADFGWEVSYSAAGGFWTDNLRFHVSERNGLNGTWVTLYKDGSGNFATQVQDVNDVSGIYIDTATSVSCPTSGSQTLSFWMKGNYLSIKTGADEVIYEGIIRRHGGKFFPRIEFTNGKAAVITTTLYAGSNLPCMALITDEQMWGYSDVAASTEGGNDANHPTTLGGAVVYSRLFHEIDMAVPHGQIGGGELRSYPSATIADDATYTIPAPIQAGHLILWSDSDNLGAHLAYTTDASPGHTDMGKGSLVDIVTAGTDLTGTTGTDGRFSISVQQNGIELENRTGGAKIMRWILLTADNT